MKENLALESMDALVSSLSALAAFVRRGTGSLVSADADTRRDQADACLSGLPEVARVEALIAALKRHLLTGNGTADTPVALPAKRPRDVP
ncbi:hypothetical protein QFZ23_002835 [Arthrobacter globiformis]|uniref:hypothetical protein n=1 Tax=Arthrobacter globiformis TaxID=1665 RepID=UPI002780BC06|nr:hypothetical protein [Arthrobacter globiformis]MDQ1058934.1 hypothetical protein [Arthrobacter globiformis]